jgi:septal ring factor EnvC (AmiA/AmiB activator)
VTVRAATRACALALAFAGSGAGSVGAQAQPGPQPPPAERLKTQKDELERIRSERAQLEARQRQLRSTVHDLSEERVNIERQAATTARLVKSLDQQLVALAGEEGSATADLIRAQDELAVKRSVLRHRVREIYKRGALYSAEALLAAQSFGELVARYKYLHLLTQRDHALMVRVDSLGVVIRRQRETLMHLRSDVESSRREKADEEVRLRALEGERTRSLAQAQARQKQTEERLRQIARDEQRLSSLIASLETERRRAEGRSGNSFTSTSTLRTSDLGRLDWPVDGEIIYRFGRVVSPNNTTTRWNGVGIAAAAGTPVKAVSSGTVVLADNMGTYGPTVIIQHGGGDYSVYGSLEKIGVAKGSKVTKGQALGTVGKTDPELDAHLHFEIRPNGRAVDPLEWLRAAKR